jgi:hypothetical protein
VHTRRRPPATAALTHHLLEDAQVILRERHHLDGAGLGRERHDGHDSHNGQAHQGQHGRSPSAAAPLGLRDRTISDHLCVQKAKSHNNNFPLFFSKKKQNWRKKFLQFF